MCHVHLLEPQGQRPDESLHLHRFAREPLSDESCFRYHSLPLFALALPRPHNLEHLVLRNTTNLGQWDGVLGGLVFPLLLDGSRKRLGILLSLAVEEICGKSAIGNCR